MRLALGADHRRPLDFTYRLGDLATPLGEAGGELRPALTLARRAPSAKNKQSWRVVVARDGGRLDVYCAFGLRGQVGTGRKSYAVSPEYLDVGTFVRSLTIGLAHDGIAGHLVVDDPGLAVPEGQDLGYLVSWVRDEGASSTSAPGRVTTAHTAPSRS